MKPTAVNMAMIRHLLRTSYKEIGQDEPYCSSSAG